MLVLDLARDLTRLAGHTTRESAIEFTGLRPGEKRYEELLADADDTIPMRIRQLCIAWLEQRSDGHEALVALLNLAESAGADAAGHGARKAGVGGTRVHRLTIQRAASSRLARLWSATARLSARGVAG